MGLAFSLVADIFRHILLQLDISFSSHEDMPYLNQELSTFMFLSAPVFLVRPTEAAVQLPNSYPSSAIC